MDLLKKSAYRVVYAKIDRFFLISYYYIHMKKNDTITDKQKFFAMEYLKDKNLSAAALRSGYSKEYGTKLLKKPHIKSFIDGKLKKRIEKMEVNQEKVLSEYAKIAFADIYTDEDDVKNPITAAAKLKALDALAKHLGLFTEKIEINGDFGNKIEVALNRAKGLAVIK